MKDTVINRLVSVKSFVTLILTVLFATLAVMGKVPAEDVKYFVTMVMVFYFTKTESGKGE